MKPVEAWLDQYSQISKQLLTVLAESSGVYSDDKLVAVEAAIALRRELLTELAGLEIGKSAAERYAPQLEMIKAMESEIEVNIRTMMSELDAQRLAVHEQRSELDRLKRANRSYAGTVQSTEGYFIDKKK